MELTYELLKKLPKTDLHCHLDGSLRVNTLIELAQEYNAKLPSYEEEGLSKFVKIGDDCKSLEEYLQAFAYTLSVMQDQDAIERIAYELAEDAAEENIRYLEVRYSPILHMEKGLKPTEIIETVLKGLKKGEKDFNIKTGLIICAMRHNSPDQSLRLAELSVAYKNKGVVAFDLAGAEKDFPAKDHREAFYLMQNNNVNCTIHAGEAYGYESIAQAIHYCGASRIGHGTKLKEDGDLLNYVNDHRIPLEICLSSNVQTKSVKDLNSHPFWFYYNYGLRVTLNTDNRLMSDTTMTKELGLAAKYYNLSLDDIQAIIINGFKSAFLPYHEKVELLNAIIKELPDYQANLI